MVDLVGRDECRPQRRARLPRLALQPLTRAPLPVAHRDIVADRVAADRAGRLVRRYVAHPAADDEGQLPLPVHGLRRLRQPDRVARPDQGGGELGEQRGVVRQLGAHFLDVAAVVEPEAEDLRRTRDHRSQIGVRERDRSAALVDAADAAFEHRRHVGGVQSYDTVALDAAGARPVGGPEGDEAHAGSALMSGPGRDRTCARRIMSPLLYHSATGPPNARSNS